MRNSSLIFCYLFLLVGLFSCSSEEIEEQMVQFDRSLIPVWYYVEMSNYDQARTAFVQLEEEWKTFKKTAVPYAAKSRQWKSSLGQVDDWMSTTLEAIEAQEAELALSQLDHARYELMDWRWRWEMDYFLDKVWDLEASINVAKSVALDPMLGLLEWEEYQKVNKDISQSWEILQAQQPDPEFFQLHGDRIQALQIRESELGALIAAYLKEGECLETCEYEEAVESLHFAFLNYLKTFGDFEGLALVDDTWSLGHF